MSIMGKYTNIFDFYPNGVTVGNSISYYNANDKDNLIIQVSGSSSITMKIQGCVDPYDSNGELKADDQCTWSDLALLKLADYSIVTTVGANGIYEVSIDGIKKARCVVTVVAGDAKIVAGFGKSINQHYLLHI